jgi:DNA-directed RNA polymerase subunit N (RpoN/RPB10)
VKAVEDPSQTRGADDGESLGERIMTTFSCFSCGSPAFTMNGVLTDDTDVRCAECGAPLGKWAMIRHQLQESLGPSEPRRHPAADDPMLAARPIAARH